MWTLAAVVLTVFPQIVTTADQGLEVLEKGGAPTEVSRAAGREAVSRIEPSMTEDALLRRLVFLARQGKAEAELTQALVTLVEGEGACTAVALGELAQSRPADLDRVSATLSPRTVGLLVDLLAEADDPTAFGALELLARVVEPAALIVLLDTWSEEEADRPRALRLIGLLERAKGPAELFQAVARMRLSQPLWGPAGDALRALVKRDPATADLALMLAERAEYGAGAIVIRSLGGLWLDDAERLTKAFGVLDLLVTEVQDDLQALTPDLTTAAVETAADLLMPSVVPLLPSLALHGPSSPLRAAAIRAMGKLCYRDAPTVDLLIKLLEDADAGVATAAYETLRAKSGQRTLPMRKDMWDRWRASADLPAEPPTPDAERLDAERALRGKSQRRLQQQRQGS